MIGQEYPGVWIGIWKPNSGLADKNGHKFMHGSKPTIKNSNDQSQLKADDVVFRFVSCSFYLLSLQIVLLAKKLVS